MPSLPSVSLCLTPVNRDCRYDVKITIASERSEEVLPHAAHHEITIWIVSIFTTLAPYEASTSFVDRSEVAQYSRCRTSENTEIRSNEG